MNTLPFFRTFYKNLPNLVSYSRVFFTLLSLWFYSQSSPELFLLCLSLALASDFFDGLVARKFNLSSPFGSVLDPACDKVLIVLMLAFFYTEGALSKVFTVLLMMRSLVQIMTALYVLRKGIHFSASPSLLAKALSLGLFFLIYLISFSLSFDFLDFLFESWGFLFFLCLLSIGEIFFMVNYPLQFYKILKREKSAFT